jgi:ribonuclease HII
MLKKRYSQFNFEAGCDEAGRGCLAGPVVAAAVVLPQNHTLNGLNDSKKLSASMREHLASEVKLKAISWAVGIVEAAEIDAINILNASFLAMHRAIDQLTVKPEYLIIDGNRFNPYPQIGHACIVKGDAQYMSIAAASILAKTQRDHIMQQLHKQYPLYLWNSNKGYPTAEHRNAIAKHGPCHYHRKSFQLLPAQLSLFR